MTRRRFTLGLLSQRRPPNILIILADDLGIGDLSCYGARDVQTPNIDALAARGLLFEDFYANCTVCSPTRAALLTGRYPDRAGVPGVIRTHADDSWGHLSPNVTLLPQALSGYHTAIVGKWHLGLQSPNTPTERGFHHFHGFLGDMMDDYYQHTRHGQHYMRRDQTDIRPTGHATDLFTQWACDYLNERARTPATPFFLYLAYNAPHTPMQPSPDSLAKAKARGLDDKRAKLVALIEHMDEGIGRVVERLRANGQLNDTLIVFTSDNGGDLPPGGTNGPWRGGKQDLYEGGIRVACVASGPGVAPGRTRARAITMDWFATACELAGAKPPADIDGVSLTNILRNPATAAPERDLVWMRREGNPRYQGRDYYAIRRGDWKLLQNSPFEPYELYHLGDDPGEKRNRIKEEAQVARDLSASLSRHIQRAGKTPWAR
jgi:arylsulfatase A-like enzyme